MMNVLLYIFVILYYCVSSELNVAVLSKNNESKSKELNSKADGALPILHIVFDTASGGDGTQSLNVATRYILNKLLNAADNFDNETMMSVSTFSGSDSGDGKYLKILSSPVNVIENNQALISIVKIDVPASVISDIARDSGAAIRDTPSLSSPNVGGILYLVSRSYVDGGPTIKEVDMIDSLLGGNRTLVCVEGTETNDTNSIFNLDRIARLTEGYYFTNTPDETWQKINEHAADKLMELSKEPINSVRQMVIKSY